MRTQTNHFVITTPWVKVMAVRGVFRPLGYADVGFSGAPYHCGSSLRVSTRLFLYMSRILFATRTHRCRVTQKVIIMPTHKHRTRGRKRNKRNSLPTASGTPYANQPSPLLMGAEMSDPKLDNKFDDMFDAYAEHIAGSGYNQWRLNQLDSERTEWHAANPYEKVLALQQYKTGEGSQFYCLDQGLSFMRANTGTQWRYEHPEADVYALNAGLKDYDLKSVSNDGNVYEFVEHSDRYAYMSGDWRAQDWKKQVRIDRRTGQTL